MSGGLTLSELPWRSGAGLAEVDTSVEPASVLLADSELDDLTTPIVESVARLVERKRQAGVLDDWTRRVSALPTTDTPTLIVKVSTTSDPLTLWAIHVALDKRNIAPCLRWPANRSEPQMEFVSWLADLMWLVKRNPLHCAKFKGWQRLFTLPPGSGAWLEVAYRVFKAMYVRQNLSSYTTRGLALADAQRQDLMMLPTSRMYAARLELQPAAFEQTRAHLLTHAEANPDKAGVHSPAAVAERRARLWRVHVLSGRQPAATARGWLALTGESISRQAIARQIVTTEAILKAR
jgi:hypothetical protein